MHQHAAFRSTPPSGPTLVFMSEHPHTNPPHSEHQPTLGLNILMNWKDSPMITPSRSNSLMEWTAPCPPEWAFLMQDPLPTPLTPIGSTMPIAPSSFGTGSSLYPPAFANLDFMPHRDASGSVGQLYDSPSAVVSALPEFRGEDIDPSRISGNGSSVDAGVPLHAGILDSGSAHA